MNFTVIQKKRSAVKVFALCRAAIYMSIPYIMEKKYIIWEAAKT